VAAENPRILDLRRRVQADPASIAFAQLAEECRRAGSSEEAVRICRLGLARHPGYLSARVTLGRALIELGQLDDAFTELSTVNDAAPDNLPAIRGVAEIHQRRGNMAEALAFYRRALQLARHDPDLEDTVERISQAVKPLPTPAQPPSVPIEELFDFDALMRQLGGEPQDAPPHAAPATVAPSVLDDLTLPADDHDALATMERELRNLADQRAADEAAARTALETRRRLAVLQELQQWLDTIQHDGGRTKPA
jgi:tetratricopeptide (TPR) repeat protein